MKMIAKSGLGIIALGATLASGVLIGQAFADQPHMRNALDSLMNARGELQEASHNKGGHRAEALRLTNQAIEEVRRGMDDAD